MADIKYVTGDTTKPIGDGRKILIHCCNDIGLMGAGVAKAISNKWPIVKSQYRKWYKVGKGFKLGNVQFVKVTDDIVVGNMIGQKGIKSLNGMPPVRYSAIAKCLEKVAKAAISNKASVHCPRFGSDLAGGKWEEIEKLLREKIISQGVDVTVYTLPRGSK